MKFILLLGVLGLILFIHMHDKGGAQNAQVTDEKLMAASNNINKTLPYTVSGQRLDTTRAMPGLKIVFYFTELTYSAASVSPSTRLTLQRAAFSINKKEFCSPGDKNELIKKGVTIVTHYSGNDGGFLWETTVTPADCQGTQ